MLHFGLTLLQRRVCSAGQGRSGQKRRQEEQGAHPTTAIISSSCHHDALWCALVIAAAAQLPHQPQRRFTQRVCPFTSAAAVQRDFPTIPPPPPPRRMRLPNFRFIEMQILNLCLISGVGHQDFRQEQEQRQEEEVRRTAEPRPAVVFQPLWRIFVVTLLLVCRHALPWSVG